MAVLPFVVQPKKNIEKIKVGNDEVGIFEIERKGYLSVAEKSFVENVTQGSDGVAVLVRLANRVGMDNKISAEKAYMAITDVMSGKTDTELGAKIADKYGEDIAIATARMAESIQRRQIAAATILIQTRINHEWTIQDTMDLDPLIVDELSVLYDREEKREPIEKKEKIEEVKEIVGK